MVPEQTDSLSDDDLFELLRSSRRRFVLTHLYRMDGPTTQRVLADELAAWEHDTPVDELTSKQRKNAYVALSQTHLPRLGNASLIRYDADATTVALDDLGHEIGAYLAGENPRTPWQLSYLAIALTSAAVYAAVLLDLPLLSEVPIVAVGLFIVIAFAIAAVAHTIYGDRTRLPPVLELLATDQDRVP